MHPDVDAVDDIVPDSNWTNQQFKKKWRTFNSETLEK